jgi:uncharacterized Fe-S cluster protein YjdI
MADEERRRPGVAREYRNERIVVRWEPRLCIHAGVCVRGLPEVFDPGARPWVAIDGATADRIAAVVAGCPTGALHAERLDGGLAEPVEPTPTIRVRPNGPLFVTGSVRLLDERGELIREDTRLALCRCGHSDNKPFCDGSHRRVGFRGEP